MYRIGQSLLKLLFQDAYNKGYKDAMVNIKRELSTPPVGRVEEQDEWLDKWIKTHLTTPE